ncbi:MAG: four helix bundle suffix domain-containing protein [Patescibacteria group bacterium]|nr:four helix bundle suffix domain-containing protein [Patescibacteria group bacterium]
MTELIAKHGGYKNLKSFQAAEIVYDYTFEFINRYVQFYKDKEQMEGAARGGKQNIGEGSQTGGTSRQSEIRLTDVARASLEELKLDYEDFLRKQSLPQWGKNDPRALAVRKLAYEKNRTYGTYRTYMSEPETAANCALCLINQATYLLDKQLAALDKQLGREEDFKERYRQVRKEQIFGAKDDYDEFLKQFGKKRLENGRVVPLDAPD